MRKKKTIEGVEIVDIGAKGKVIGKKDGVAYLTQGAVPGDVVTLDVRKKRKGMFEGKVAHFEQRSKDRTDALCKHFAHCGGCSWQDLQYKKQLELKADRVEQQMRRIGGLDEAPIEPILAAPESYAYRNKLEFTFVSEGWLTPEQIQSDQQIEKTPALGFHVPGRFDWVLQVDECHLMENEHNAIRNFIYQHAITHDLSFYHPRDKHGLLRNVVLRKNRKNQWMILLIVFERTPEIDVLSEALTKSFPSIASLWLIYNQKVNDSYSDCDAECIHGETHLIEQFERPDGSTTSYMIGPKSFFQTNTNQAERLYQLIYEWANVQNGEIVYDLYTGTGSIALFVADKASKVIGVEYVPEAIEDADKNAKLNAIEHCEFFAGDMKDVLNTAFVDDHGKPDVMIVDPPRAGMHSDVVNCILETKPPRLVYVSCDPATQARDIQLLSESYRVERMKPVDMFPHTSHVENVALLLLKD